MVGLKACLVAMAYTQKKGVKFIVVFSPIMKH